MNELVVLDYSAGEVHFYQVNENIEINEDFISSLGRRPNDCSWMYNKFIDIIKHEAN